VVEEQIKSIPHLKFPRVRKYLGFYIKPNDDGVNDLKWLIAKVERRITLWCNKWLSRGGCLILIKSMLKAIPIYWHSLVFIPNGILEKIKQNSFRFLSSS